MSNIMDVVQMVSYSGILIQVMTTRCKVTFFTRLCRLRLCLTFCKHGLQGYNILFAGIQSTVTVVISFVFSL